MRTPKGYAFAHDDGGSPACHVVQQASHQAQFRFGAVQGFHDPLLASTGFAKGTSSWINDVVPLLYRDIFLRSTGGVDKQKTCRCGAGSLGAEFSGRADNRLEVIHETIKKAESVRHDAQLVGNHGTA
ncbi:MAG: hypothetical protein UX57_C0004G0083 [Candidatus Uhrbacteria bacterium GW2011_GWE2_46_68]|uniref:Uncharacterized protein n=2 Tax=Candidatus Uhriibacteriota TaxID=1752732 RepID=A0A0G1Q8Q0_9BACT|nr:MAG: hypothetical protein UX45_C0001G0057 [Candidatus Uhrbacteria bacterium GW2011_GWF2_46_218]KKU41379.1 MAG: hypothetical protein UX57_C0004G0083 [Candidatus Uhrbacteria bacterium GW2011_GWE2_46_68]